MKYKVFLKIVNADNEKEAIFEGLVQYRKNYGFVETVHLWNSDNIVDKVEITEEV